MLEKELKKEILRKSIHLTSLWIPLVYSLYGSRICSILLLLATIIMLYVDISRCTGQKSNLAGKVIDFFKLNNVFRSHETSSLSGASYMLLGALIAIFCFSKSAFVPAYTILIISDTCAALIGKAWGKHRIYRKKTLEGTLSFFISAISIVVTLHYLLGFMLIPAIIACIVATMFELYAKKLLLDDNILIPFSYCIVFEICKNLI